MNAVVASVQDQSTSLLQVIERAARDTSVDIDKMERLMQMHERIVARDSQAAYASALAEMQPELPMISERGGIRDRNGNVQSKYALWEDVIGIITPILSKHGFALSFRTGNDANGVTVTGVLSHRLGHSEQTSLTLPIDTSGSKNAVQSVGSSTSYGKRYTSAALLNLRTGEKDDDGKAGGATGLVSDEQAANIQTLMTEVGGDSKAFLNYFGVELVADLKEKDYKRAMSALKKRQKAGAK